METLGTHNKELTVIPIVQGLGSLRQCRIYIINRKA